MWSKLIVLWVSVSHPPTLEPLEQERINMTP
jgi:hypothetical protein